MSLKFFFMSLTEDELEFICHHYVHNWINEELHKSNRLLSKYQVEQKLEYVNSKGSVPLLGKSSSMIQLTNESVLEAKKKIPSYMAPTIVKV